MTKAFNPALPVQTRDGRPVRILCTDLESLAPIVGAVRESDGSEVIDTWLPDGRLYSNTDNNPSDLINVPTKRRGWILVKPHGGDTKVIAVTSHVYASQPVAVDDNCASWQIIEIEFDE